MMIGEGRVQTRSFLFVGRMTRWQGVGFVVFCLLGGSQWIAASALPTTLPLFEQESLHYFLVGVVAFAALLFCKRSASPERLPWHQLAMASLLLLSVPTVFGEAANGVTVATRVGLFALGPLLIVVGASWIGAEFGSGRALMMPALVGLSGMVLLVPFELPSHVATGMSFALNITGALATSVGSLWMYRLLRRCGVLPALVVMCGANALLMGFAAGWTHQFIVPLAHDIIVEATRCAVFDLPLLLLLVWLLREMPPTKFAVRFLLVPLVSALEGASLLHTGIGLRMACGMGLIVIGSGALLFWRFSDALDDGPLLGLR